MNPRFAIDSLAVRGGRISGWGWLLDEASPATEILLCWAGPDGRERRLRCPQLGSRPDLAQAFPAIAHASGGGFMLHGRVPADEVDARLQARLADGRTVEVPLPGFPRSLQPMPLAPEGRSARLRRLLRTGDWRGVLAILGNLWRRLLPAPPPHPRGAPWRQPPGGRMVVLDHAMGGGANRFREERVAQWRSEGLDVLVLTPDLVTLDYRLHAVDPKGTPELHRYPDLARCLHALGRCDRVVVNDLVSFDDPEQVLEWAVSQRAAGARLTFYLHDFHAACPAFTLTAPSGRDCGLPDLATCAACLPANGAPFLGLMPRLDVVAWREAWARFLDAADEIVAFSEASVRLLARAHPRLPLARVAVQPHSLDYLGLPGDAFHPPPDPLTTIAVVGNISQAKGAQVVAEMVALIEREHWPARIVVIGGIDGVRASPALRIVGAYTPGELPAILAREQASVAFLPSVVHETFSYVTAELMHFGVPLAVFDLGAPAERVRHYPLGAIVPAVDARAALRTLVALHHRVAGAPAAPVGASAGIP